MAEPTDAWGSAALIALILVGFICGFFAAIELHQIDPPCLLNDPPCEVTRR